MTFSLDEAKEIGEEIGIDWEEADFTPESFLAGLEVELEHGTVNDQTNVTDDDPAMTGKIALAHLLESPIYYDLLAKMETGFEEEEAERVRQPAAASTKQTRKIMKRQAMNNPVEKPIRLALEKALQKYDDLWDSEAGDYYARDFDKNLDAWIRDVAEVVQWAEDSGTGDITGIDDSYGHTLAGILFKLGGEDGSKIYNELEEAIDSVLSQAFDAAVQQGKFGKTKKASEGVLEMPEEMDKTETQEIVDHIYWIKKNYPRGPYGYAEAQRLLDLFFRHVDTKRDEWGTEEIYETASGLLNAVVDEDETIAFYNFKGIEMGTFVAPM